MEKVTLYFLHEGEAGDAHLRRDLVHAAAKRASIGFVAIDSLNCNYLDLPTLRPGDMLFNSGRGSTRLETLLWRDAVGSFRTCGSDVFTNGTDSTPYCAVLQREGFPVPRTCHRLPPSNDDLPMLVESLGGFPIVVKAAEGTLGIGVMIVESLRSLRSLLDFLRTTNRQFILREYIEPLHLARLLIIADTVIASLKYAIHPNDFRGLPYRCGGEPMTFGLEVEQLAIAVGKAVRHAFVGVDIIIDKTGKAYVLEVNPPSNFVSIERDLGIPVSDMLVRFLLDDAQSKAIQD